MHCSTIIGIITPKRKTNEKAECLLFFHSCPVFQLHVTFHSSLHHTRSGLPCAPSTFHFPRYLERLGKFLHQRRTSCNTEATHWIAYRWRSILFTRIHDADALCRNKYFIIISYERLFFRENERRNSASKFKKTANIVRKYGLIFVVAFLAFVKKKQAAQVLRLRKFVRSPFLTSGPRTQGQRLRC